MGNYVSSLSEAFGFNPVEKRVIFHGLDASGKTTILYKLKLGTRNEVLTAIPTIGTTSSEVYMLYVIFWKILSYVALLTCF